MKSRYQIAGRMALAVLMVLIVALLVSVDAQAANTYTKVVSATNVNTSVNFITKVVQWTAINNGTAPAYLDTDGTASAADTTSSRIDAGEGMECSYPAGYGPTAIGVITASSTATVRVDGFFNVGTSGDRILFGCRHFPISSTSPGASPAFTNGTFSGTLGVTGVATFTAQPILSSLTASRIMLTDASKGPVSNGAITTNALPKSASSGASLSASSVSDDGTTVSTTEPISSSGASIAGKIFRSTPQAFTVADSGDGAAATGTLTPTSSVVLVTCSDSDGCTVTMGEGSATSGDILRIVNVSANTATFADTSGLSETTGSIALGQWDSLSFVYATDRWVDIGSVNN